MQVFITPFGNGYQVTILGEEMPDLISYMAQVAPHLSLDKIDAKIPKKIYLEKVTSDKIDPEVETNRALLANSAIVLLLIFMCADIPAELKCAQLTAIGDYSVRSTENGIGFLTIVNGNLRFSPINAERKYPKKDMYVITSGKESSITPSFTNADFMNEPVG